MIYWYKYIELNIK